MSMTHDEMIAVIQAHKEGKDIQRRSKHENEGWRDCFCPAWNFLNSSYRVKPEPKPDIIQYIFADRFGFGFKQGKNNIRLTFDGETGKLKSAEVL